MGIHAEFKVNLRRIQGACTQNLKGKRIARFATPHSACRELTKILVQKIYEVDLPRFLVGRSMVLEEGRDAERIAELIETLGFECYLAPETEGISSGVGIGEDDDLVVH